MTGRRLFLARAAGVVTLVLGGPTLLVQSLRRVRRRQPTRWLSIGAEADLELDARAWIDGPRHPVEARPPAAHSRQDLPKTTRVAHGMTWPLALEELVVAIDLWVPGEAMTVTRLQVDGLIPADGGPLSFFTGGPSGTCHLVRHFGYGFGGYREARVRLPGRGVLLPWEG